MISKHIMATLSLLTIDGLSSGQSHSTLWARSGQQNLSQFGWSASLANDLSGDGYGDVVVGAPGPATGPGLVMGCSGLDGAVLWARAGPVVGSGFGTALSVVGDADGDGIHDVIVGAPNNVGAAHMISGRDGHIIWTFSGASIPAQGIGNVGMKCAAIGDVTSDGYADAWVQGIDLLPSFGVMLDGRSDLPVRYHNNTDSQHRVTGACTVGDRDGDGYDDYCYGSIEDITIGFPFMYYGSITIASGHRASLS